MGFVDSKTAAQVERQLATDLAGNEKLSNFGTFSAEHKLEDERALGIMEWEQKEYDGVGSITSHLDPEAGISTSAIETYESEIAGDASVAIDEGAVETEISGYALAALRVSKLVDAGAPLVAPTLLLGELVYLDITTGSNPLTHDVLKLFGSDDEPESHETTGLEGTGIKREKWVWVPGCSGKTVTQCVTYWRSEAGESRKVYLEWPQWYNGSWRIEASPPAPAAGAYFLAAETTETSNTFYTAAAAYSGGGAYGSHEQACDEQAAGWEPVEPGGGLIGWPMVVPHSTTIAASSEYFEHACLFHRSEPSEWREGHISREAQSITRSEEQMAVGLTRSHTPPEGARGIEGTPYESAGALREGVEALATHLEGEEPGHLGEMFDHATEGNEGKSTLPGAHTIPSCSGKTGTECDELMKADGFKHITLATLTWAEDTMELREERVTALSKAPGTLVDLDAAITITQNPSARTVAKKLEERPGPKSKPEPSKEEYDVIAERCLYLAAKGGVTESECANEPIFVSGNNTPETTKEDEKALEREPDWVGLHFVSKAEQMVTEGWYKSYEPCNVAAPEGKACHEFPFYTTEEAGWPKAGAKPAIEYVKTTDNSSQGGLLGAFQTNCSLSRGQKYLYAPQTATPSYYIC